MPINTRVSCPAGVWTQITNGDASGKISVMLASDTPVSLQATVGATTPTDTAGPMELLSYGDGWSEAAIVAKFPGVAGALRLWAKPRETGKASVVGISAA